MSPRFLLALAPAAALMMTLAFPAGGESVVIDFTDPAEVGRWSPVHDRVMGGVSDGALTADPAGHARFAGRLSTDFGGGFASVRRAPAALGYAGARAFRVRVRGDGRRYQLRFRPGSRLDGVAWRAHFRAETDWQDIVLPAADFEPTYRGRPVPEAGRLAVAEITQVGLMIADKQLGPFRLDVALISPVYGD